MPAWSSPPGMARRSSRATSTAASAAASAKPGLKIKLHGTRKTCGSLVAALDMHPRVAMQILRHSRIAVTMEIYTEIPSVATREPLRKLDS